MTWELIVAGQRNNGVQCFRANGDNATARNHIAIPCLLCGDPSCYPKRPGNQDGLCSLVCILAGLCFPNVKVDCMHVPDRRESRHVTSVIAVALAVPVTISFLI